MAISKERKMSKRIDAIFQEIKPLTLSDFECSQRLKSNQITRFNNVTQRRVNALRPTAMNHTELQSVLELNGFKFEDLKSFKAAILKAAKKPTLKNFIDSCLKEIELFERQVQFVKNNVESLPFSFLDDNGLKFIDKSELFKTIYKNGVIVEAFQALQAVSNGAKFKPEGFGRENVPVFEAHKTKAFAPKTQKHGKVTIVNSSNATRYQRKHHLDEVLSLASKGINPKQELKNK